jgi:hypothetical protein
MTNQPTEPEADDPTQADDPPYFYDPADYPDAVQPDHDHDAEAAGLDVVPDPDFVQRPAQEA